MINVYSCRAWFVARRGHNRRRPISHDSVIRDRAETGGRVAASKCGQQARRTVVTYLTLEVPPPVH